jgi:hypothetical protein
MVGDGKESDHWAVLGTYAHRSLKYWFEFQPPNKYITPFRATMAWPSRAGGALNRVNTWLNARKLTVLAT